jgi:excisionase family DNA binding protein
MKRAAPAALSVEEAAHYLGISRAGLYRIFKAGALRPARIGGRTVVRRVDLDNFLARAVDCGNATVMDQ